MWSKSLITFPLLLLIFTINCLTSDKTAQAAQIQHIGFDWSSSSSAMLSMIGQDHDLQLDDDYYDDQDESSSSSSSRRSLYWKKRYYISYGALSANRVPCPPRSGRSYYTHNCFAARAPANPYHRGCSCISRCRR